MSYDAPNLRWATSKPSISGGRGRSRRRRMSTRRSGVWWRGRAVLEKTGDDARRPDYRERAPRCHEEQMLSLLEQPLPCSAECLAPMSDLTFDRSHVSDTVCRRLKPALSSANV